MMELSDIAKETTYDALADWVYLGEIASLVTSRGEAQTTDAALPAVLDTVRVLVGEGLMELGAVDSTGFTRWERPLEESIQYIREYASRHAEDSWHYLAWLNNTPKGVAYAESLDPELFDE